MKEEETKYTFYRVDFNDCSLEYDYTICQTLEDVLEVLKSIDIDLDDDGEDRSPSATITGIGMTEKEWDEWVKEAQEGI